MYLSRIRHDDETAPSLIVTAVESEDDQRPYIQSVDRAVEMMEVLGRDGSAGVTELSKELAIHKSTAYRLLSTLERRGMVERHRDTQKYRLGFGVIRLAGAVRATLELTRVAHPVCERLSRAADEAVNLAVLEGHSVVNIDQSDLSSSVIGVNWVGQHTSLHGTSSGKVFLAHLPNREREAVLAGALERFTERTLVGADELRAELAQIRRVGFAVALEELEEGLHAVAAPIRTADGSVRAAVSVSGPAYRLTLERIEREVASLVRQAADTISRRVGYLGQPGVAAESPGVLDVP